MINLTEMFICSSRWYGTIYGSKLKEAYLYCRRCMPVFFGESDLTVIIMNDSTIVSYFPFTSCIGGRECAWVFVKRRLSCIRMV